jgi:hypothetical protein
LDRTRSRKDSRGQRRPRPQAVARRLPARQVVPRQADGAPVQTALHGSECLARLCPHGGSI